MKYVNYPVMVQFRNKVFKLLLKDLKVIIHN